MHSVVRILSRKWQICKWDLYKMHQISAGYASFCSSSNNVAEIPYLEFIIGLQPQSPTASPMGCMLSAATGDNRPHPGYETRLIRLRIENATTAESREAILKERRYMRDFSKFWIPMISDLMGGPYHHYTLEVFTWLKNNLMILRSAKYPETERLYSMMISYAGVAGHTSLARSYFDDMEKKGIKQSTKTCNALLIAYAKAGDETTTLTIFKTMKGYRRECAPDALTYFILISMYVRIKEWLGAKQMVKDCKDARFTPDISVYNTLLHGYSRAGREDDFNQVYEEIKGHSQGNINQETMNILLVGYSRLGNLVKLQNVIEEMQTGGVQILCREVSYQVVQTYMGKTCQGIDSVIQLVEGSSLANERFQTLVLQVFLEASDIEKATEYVAHLCYTRKEFVELQVFERFMEGLVKNGEFKKVYNVFKWIKKAKFHLRPQSYEVIITGLVHGDCFREVGEIGLYMEEPGNTWPVTTLNVLLDAYVKAGNSIKVAQVRDKLRELRQSCSFSQLT